jgi:hypothetical protein
MRFLPESRAGRRAMLLAAAATSLGAAARLIAATQGNTIEYPNPINSPLLGTVLYLTFLTAFAAAYAGVVALRRHGERSILVYLVVILGGGLALGALLLAIGALIGPPGP